MLLCSVNDSRRIHIFEWSLKTDAVYLIKHISTNGLNCIWECIKSKCGPSFGNSWNIFISFWDYYWNAHLKFTFIRPQFQQNKTDIFEYLLHIESIAIRKQLEFSISIDNCNIYWTFCNGNTAPFSNGCEYSWFYCIFAPYRAEHVSRTFSQRKLINFQFCTLSSSIFNCTTADNFMRATPCGGWYVSCILM